MRSYARRPNYEWFAIYLFVFAACSTETDNSPNTGGMGAASGGVGGASGVGGGGIGGGGGSAGGSGGVGGSVIAGSGGVGGTGGGGIGGMNAGAGGSAGMNAGEGGAGGMMAGAGGGGGMMAGEGGTGGDEPEMSDCGSDGTVGEASNAGSGSGSGYANVRLAISADNQITRLRTTLEVPVEPDGNTTLFIWPGLEPLQGGANYQPIGTGVLQPVLTWGGSCAPGSPGSLSGDHWWISGQYVNTLGNEPGFTGCKGGDVMDVEIGDQLLIDMSLDGSVWTQTMTSEDSGMEVDFAFDLEDQAQRWALFEIERATSSRPASDIVFTNTLIVFENPEPEACEPTRGMNDYYSAPIVSKDGLRCCIERIVLREQGVEATTTDPPP